MKKYLSNISIPVLCLLLLPTVYLYYKLNNDTWFLLACGREILTEGFPSFEPFSFHEGLSFTMQQWLYGVLSHWLYQGAGIMGLFAWMALCHLYITFVMYRLCMLCSGNKKLSAALLTFAAMYVMRLNILTRPLTLTYCILITALWCVEYYLHTKKPLALLPLPLLSALLVNMQASMWLLLFVLLIPYLLEALLFALRRTPGYQHTLVYLGIASISVLLAGFLNPYGLSAMTYVFRSFGVEEINKTVGEMGAVALREPEGTLLYPYLLIHFVLLVMHKQKNIAPRHLFLLLGFLYLSLSSYRSIGLVLLAFPLCVSHVRKNQTEPTIPDGKTLRIISVFLACFLVCVGFFRMHQGEKAFRHPDAAVLLEALCELPPESLRVYTNTDRGNYATYLGIPMYIDCRAEVYFKANNHQKDIFLEYLRALRGNIHCRDFLAAYNFTHVLVEPNGILYTYMPYATDYVLIAESPLGRLYQHKDYTPNQ